MLVLLQQNHHNKLKGCFCLVPFNVFLHIYQDSPQFKKPCYNNYNFIGNFVWIVYLEVPEDHMIIIFILTRFMSVHSLNFSFIWCNRNFVNIVLYFTTKIVFCCWTTVNLSTTNSITINNLTNCMFPNILHVLTIHMSF